MNILFAGGRNRFDSYISEGHTFSTKLLVCAYHAVVFKTKVLQFKNENTVTKYKNGTGKFKRILSFLFKEKRKLFIMRKSTLFSSWQSTWLVSDQPTCPCFLYSIVKESKFLEGNFCIYRELVYFLYILTSVWKKKNKICADLKLILSSAKVLITALITQNKKFILHLCNFQISRRVFLGLSTSVICSKRKCLFL